MGHLETELSPGDSKRHNWQHIW